MPAPVFGNNNLALTVGTTDYPCIHLPAELHLAPDQRESFIEIPEGCEPIKARVWMAKSQLDALPADVKSGATPVGIKMSGQAFDTIAPTTVDQRTIETGAKMYLVKASVVQHGINDSIYELQLRGEQWFWKRGAYTDNYYNVLGPDRKTYSMGYGADSSTAKTFQEIVTALAGQLGISLTLPSTPTWVPQNVYSDSSPGALLDRLLRPMGMRVVCDPWTVFTYSIEQLDYTDTVDESHLTALSAVAGHEGCNVARDITPAVYRPAQAACRFPRYPFPSGNSDLFYIEPATSNPVSGGKGVARISVGDYYYRSDNHTQITNIANERCTNLFKRVNITHETWTFIGGYELTPGPTIRKVRVTMDLDGWFTVVTRHGLALPLRSDNEDQQFWPDSARWPEHNAIDGGVIPIPGDDGTCNFETVSVMVPLKIKSLADSNGQYNLIIGQAKAGDKFDPTTNLDLSSHYTFTDDSDHAALGVNIEENPGTTNQLTVGQIMFGFFIGRSYESTSIPVYAINTIANKIFAVNVTQTGGTDGSIFTTPTYTYTINTIGGVSLGTGKSPAWARSYGSFNTATHGTAYFDNSGALVLYQIDETEKTCTG